MMTRTISHRLYAFVFCVFLAGTEAFADGPVHIAPFTMPSARYGALGGTHAAYAKGFDAILINPAAYAKMPSTKAIAEVSPSLYSNNNDPFGLINNILKVVDVMGKKDPDTSELTALGDTLKLLENLTVGFDLGGPIAAGFINKGVGLGFFNRTHVDFSISGQSVRFQANEDVFVSGGYGWRIPWNIDSHDLDVGVGGKIFYRFSGNTRIKILSLIDGNTDILIPATSTIGFGFDLGVQYTGTWLPWEGHVLTGAIVCRDIASFGFPSQAADMINDSTFKSQDVTVVHPNLDFSVAYKFPLAFDGLNFGELNFMLDYRDFTDLIVPQGVISRNALLNFGFGVEYFFPWNFLALRIGLADSLPALGLGLITKAFEFDFALHGKELGYDPGVRPVWVMDIGFLFRIQ